MRFAIADLVTRCFFINSLMRHARTRLVAVAVTSSRVPSSARKSSSVTRDVDSSLSFSFVPPKCFGALARQFQIVIRRHLRLLDEAMEQNHLVTHDSEQHAQSGPSAWCGLHRVPGRAACTPACR